MKMEQKERSETSLHNIQMSGNYPIQYLQHGESLKSKKTWNDSFKDGFVEFNYISEGHPLLEAVDKESV
jgi:hypothetical protein